MRLYVVDTSQYSARVLIATFAEQRKREWESGLHTNVAKIK